MEWRGFQEHRDRPRPKASCPESCWITRTRSAIRRFRAGQGTRSGHQLIWCVGRHKLVPILELRTPTSYSGPPGVGKTLTVEATSERTSTFAPLDWRELMNYAIDLHKPLYVVSAGELGTDPSTLDKALAKIFALVPIWGAVVLIDEADVYLEERSAADVGRNAMVAVFLRQIEWVCKSRWGSFKALIRPHPRYFCGILFLTTNRVKTFDQAFQSRIHLSLHYDNLSRDAREQLWKAFLEKARGNPLGLQHPTPAEVRQLSEKALNGRQIKMVVKLAITLANHKTEKLSFKHLAHTMDIHIDNPGFHQRIPDSPNRGERWWWWWVNLFRGGPIEERPYPY